MVNFHPQGHLEVMLEVKKVSKMGSRKRNSANMIKDLKKNIVSASLNNCPTSPRKMRLVAD